MDEEQVRAELQRVLRYANKAEVGKALKKSKATTNRWARGETGDTMALMSVKRLLGLPADTTKEASQPEWAKRLEEKLDTIARRVGSNHELLEEIAGLDRDVAAEVRDEPHSGAPPPQEEAPDQDELESTPQ